MIDLIGMIKVEVASKHQIKEVLLDVGQKELGDEVI